MCRHFAYLGPQARLADLILAPPHGPLKQSWAPRRQSNGLLNADGFGIGWYPRPGAEPLRYRRSVPIWTDADFPTTARGTTADAMLGAVRSATPGNPVTEAATAPFAHGRLLFSHNGALPGWPESAADLAADLPWTALARQHVLLDSTLLWALFLHLLEDGTDEVGALAEVTRRARRIRDARVNLLLHDGSRILATAAGDSLCYLQGEHPDESGTAHPGVIVASEPFDDSAGWVDVPEDHLLVATQTHVTVRHLSEVGAPVAGRDELLLEAP